MFFHHPAKPRIPGKLAKKNKDSFYGKNARGVPRVPLSFRDFHHNISGRSSSVHSRHNSIHMPLQHGPLRIAKDDICNRTGSQILLITDVLVGCEKNLKTRFLRRCKQLTIFQRVPSEVFSLFDVMIRKE